MHNIDEINSILNAVNEINLKSKIKDINFGAEKNSIHKLNQDLKVSPDVDKIIKEAEEYKKQSLYKSPKVDLNKTKSDNKTQENIETQIFENLYLKSTKKIKKNTLKTIFDLHLKIKNLEKKLENLQTKKKRPIIKEKTIDEYDTHINFDYKNVLRKEVVNTLSIQDSSLHILNNKIINFKKTEEALRFQIIDLEQDKQLLSNKLKKFDELKVHRNNTNKIKENLKSIYKQVEKQKKIFIDLKNYSIKADWNSGFFKENYEKLIVENNEVKKRLIIAKEQIVAHESNKQDLLSSINQLNEILSKTNITAKLSSFRPFTEVNIIKKKTEITE